MYRLAKKFRSGPLTEMTVDEIIRLISAQQKEHYEKLTLCKFCIHCVTNVRRIDTWVSSCYTRVDRKPNNHAPLHLQRSSSEMYTDLAQRKGYVNVIPWMIQGRTYYRESLRQIQ